MQIFTPETYDNLIMTYEIWMKQVYGTFTNAHKENMATFITVNLAEILQLFIQFLKFDCLLTEHIERRL